MVLLSGIHKRLWEKRLEILFDATVYLADAAIVFTSVIVVLTILVLTEYGYELSVSAVEEYRDEVVVFAVAILTVYRLPGPRSIANWLSENDLRNL